MAVSCGTIFRSLNSQINEKLKRHWTRVEDQIKSKSKSQIRQTVATSSKLEACLNLNFEYKFFELIKSTLYDSSLIKSCTDMEWIMSYCVNECIQQFEMFGVGEKRLENVTFDEQDVLNMIELENNFKTNLLNLMHSFKNIHATFKTINTNKKVSFNDYMAALISIYLDICLDLRSKIKRFGKVTEFKRKNLKDSLCINSFFLLDLDVYYVTNALLQMKNLNEKNIELVFPITNKIIDIRQSQYHETNISLYLRFLLLYARLRFIAQSKSEIFDNYRTFIYSIEIPVKFHQYFTKLIKKYHQNNSEKQKLLDKINGLDSKPRKLRKLILLRLNQESIENLIIALHNKSINRKPQENSTENTHISIEYVSDPKHLVINNPTLDGNTTPQKLPDHLIQCVEEYIKRIENNNPPPDEILDDVNDKGNESMESLNMYDELEFTSCSELTQYDINDYEYDIVNPNQRSLHQSEEMINSPRRELPERSDPIVNEFNDFSDDNPLIIYSTPKKLITSTDNFLNYKVSDERIYSSRKKYEQLLESRGSPTKETISKLNLFRNIFLDGEEYSTTARDNPIDSSDFIRKPTEIRPEGKFYKINDLVSVMLNETESPVPSPKSVEPELVDDGSLKGNLKKCNVKQFSKMEPQKFYQQTKLNFKITKLICNAEARTVHANAKKNGLHLRTQKNSPKKKSKMRSKKKEATKRKWQKINYKNILNKDYEMRTRNSIVNYFEPKTEPMDLL